MKDIKKDLEAYNWEVELQKIGSTEVITISFIRDAGQECRYIRKIVGGRAQVKAVTVGSLNFILIAK